MPDCRRRGRTGFLRGADGAFLRGRLDGGTSTLIPEASRLRFLVALESRFSAVLVTHDVEEAVALADRVLVMEGGKLIFETAVDLDRPRARSGRVFIDLKERVLAQVMQGR